MSARGRLGDAPEQLAAFHRYIAAFSAGDFDVFPAFYCDDIQFDLTVAPVLHGKAAVIEFYREMFSLIREQVRVERVAATPDTLTVDIDVLFTALEDAPAFPLQPLRAGDELRAEFTVRYWLRAGLIARLRVSPRAFEPSD